MNWRKANGWLTLGWLTLIPLSFLWRNSLIWIVFMSHYAIVASHLAAWRADVGD